MANASMRSRPTPPSPRQPTASRNCCRCSSPRVSRNRATSPSRSHVISSAQMSSRLSRSSTTQRRSPRTASAHLDSIGSGQLIPMLESAPSAVIRGLARSAGTQSFAGPYSGHVGGLLHARPAGGSQHRLNRLTSSTPPAGPGNARSLPTPLARGVFASTPCRPRRPLGAAFAATAAPDDALAVARAEFMPAPIRRSSAPRWSVGGKP